MPPQTGEAEELRRSADVAVVLRGRLLLDFGLVAEGRNPPK